jgi:hypothetical protein
MEGLKDGRERQGMEIERKILHEEEEEKEIDGNSDSGLDWFDDETIDSEGTEYSDFDPYQEVVFRSELNVNS